MSELLLAVDPSSTTVGLAFFDNGDLIQTKRIAAKGKHGERLQQIASEMASYVVDQDVVVIESPWKVTGRDARTAAILNQVFGGIKFQAWMNKCRVIEVLPGAWRKVCGLHGNRIILKLGAMSFARSVYNIECPTHDEAEAVCIGHWYLSTRAREGFDATQPRMSEGSGTGFDSQRVHHGKPE